MKTSYIVDGVRTPIGSLGGMLASVRTDDLAAHAIKALVEKFPNLDPYFIDDVIYNKCTIRSHWNDCKCKIKRQI